MNWYYPDTAQIVTAEFLLDPSQYTIHTISKEADIQNHQQYALLSLDQQSKRVVQQHQWEMAYLILSSWQVEVFHNGVERHIRHAHVVERVPCTDVALLSDHPGVLDAFFAEPTRPVHSLDGTHAQGRVVDGVLYLITST